ncbi:SDR family oxidoreductase [Asanoa sp. NPDC049518]|uniref:SDR family oxidoreductase n=1 Tax=unclassified Asanoa TaxID=2685164 RepID=UPI00343483C9
MGTAIVVGGTGGLGLPIAAHLAARGDTVVVTSRTKDGAETAAAEIGAGVQGLALDLAHPETIEAALAPITEVDHLVLTAMHPTTSTLAEFDVTAAVTAHTVKLVGYVEVVRVLRDRFRPNASVVLFGGVAKDLPYPGSTVVTTHNAGLGGLVRTLAGQIAPHRINVIHPGVVGDSPRWREVPNHPHVARSPIGRLVTVAEIVDATEFLLRNSGINGQELYVEGGVLTS